MRLDHAGVGHDGTDPVGHAVHVLDPRHDAEYLAAAEALALDSLAHHHAVERRDVGAHRQPVDRRGRDQAHLPHPRQRQLQRARYGRGRQGQHMHVGLQLLQLFFVRHAEMLFLIDHQQAKVGELDPFGQQRVGTDDDVDVARRQAFANLDRLLGRHHAGQLRHADRQAGKARGKGAVVLPGQQRGGHDDGNLRPGHRRHKRRAQRDFGLAKPHVAADQPVHRAACGQIFQHVADGARLILGFGKREAGAELVPRTLCRGQGHGVPRPPGGGGADQLASHVLDALLHAGLAPLPAGTAQLVQRHTLRLGSKAR